MARQSFPAGKDTAGETIYNFMSRLHNLAEQCDYGKERNNQLRDLAISFIKDKQLKAKLYREDNLTLTKIIDIMAQFHYTNALILVPKTVSYVSKGKGKPITLSPMTRKFGSTTHLRRINKIYPT